MPRTCRRESRSPPPPSSLGHRTGARSHGRRMQRCQGRRNSEAQKLNWYALRWRIETYHKILKSGCHAEELKLRTADRLVHVLAVCCILAWRIFWLTMMRRATRQAVPTLAFTSLEIELLARTAGKHDRPDH
ncbi:MAG: transposase, partial [Planctomycetes bacterium]|nr:transposase [Planctomycetota bacterium]